VAIISCVLNSDVEPRAMKKCLKIKVIFDFTGVSHFVDFNTKILGFLPYNKLFKVSHNAAI
jgi:hypothetical protein